MAFAGILLGQLTGSPYFDGGTSIVIGLFLGGVAIWLAYETKDLLIRESANPEIVRGIREIARKM
jgi:divalent metal cation (Fe/Co/Zn/Cd) transporter